SRILTVLVFTLRLPTPALFPYATLFRSDIRTVLRSYVEAINERLDDDTRVALSHGQEPRLYISLLGEANLDTEPFNREWLVIPLDRKSTRLNSSHVKISYAVFCLKKKRI